jgi:hypothetical protein
VIAPQREKISYGEVVSACRIVVWGTRTATSSAVVPGAKPSTSTPVVDDAPRITNGGSSTAFFFASCLPPIPANALLRILEFGCSAVPLVICRPTLPLIRAPSSPPSIPLCFANLSCVHRESMSRFESSRSLSLPEEEFGFAPWTM